MLIQLILLSIYNLLYIVIKLSQGSASTYMKLCFFTNRQYREDKILNWISVGLIVFVTSFVWMPKRDGLQAIFALAFLIPLLCVIPFRKPEFKAYGGWFSTLALIFAAYSVLTSYWAPVSKMDFFVIQWVVLATWLVGISWLAVHREINWEKIQNLLLLIGSLVGLIHLLVFYGSHPFTDRLEGLIVAKNPNEIGALYGILTLIAFCQWLRASGKSLSTHYALLMVILMAPVFFSQSRGAILALVISASIAVFYIPPSRKKVFILMLLIGAGGVGAFLSWNFLNEGLIMNRLAIGSRDVVWKEILSRSVSDHLWFGIGMEKFEKIIIRDVGVFDHAHNTWLDTFYRTGLVGLILALIHVGYVMRKFQPIERQIPIFLWLQYGLIASLLDYRTFFWQIDFKWFLFWIPLGLISAMHIHNNKNFYEQRTEVT